MKTAVVTGATGFIGNALTRKLIQEGVFVYAVGRSEKKLESLSRLQNVAVIQARFEEYGSLAEKVNCAPDVLYHCAYAGGFSADALKDYSLQLDNAKYACAAVESAIGMHCKKFVLTSTVNTAEILTFLNTENFSPRFTCIYSASKLASELMGKTLAHQGGMQFCTALIAMPYGEGNLSQTLPNIVIRQLKNRTSPKLIEGNHLYDLIYIDDVAEGLLAIGKCGKDFRDYYVGHRKLMTFRSWITKIRDAISPEMELRFGEYPDAPALDYRFLDLDALFRDSGFEAAADFESSIQRTAEWLIKMEGNGNGGGGRILQVKIRDFSEPEFNLEELCMKTAVVTGAAGFIGGAFTAYLLEKGYRVFAVSRDPSRIKGVLENEQFRPVKADFSEYGLLSNQISKADIFYHFAWDGVGGENAVNYEIQLENVKATCEAIQQAAKIGCKKFVYAGSVSELEIRECLDKNVCAPRLHCVYASAKLTAETLCKILAAQYGILFNAGLFANIIGPGDYSRRSTNSILNQFLHGEAPKLVKGDGLNDWLYIKDAVRLIEAMGEYGKHNKTYYIGHTELWPLRKTIEKARDIVAPGLQLKFGVIPDTFLTDYSYVDPQALFLDTGCKASYSFTQAIRETADWVRTLSF